jgi:hypothetical protein
MLLPSTDEGTTVNPTAAVAPAWINFLLDIFDDITICFRLNNSKILFYNFSDLISYSFFPGKNGYRIIAVKIAIKTEQLKFSIKK